MAARMLGPELKPLSTKLTAVYSARPVTANALVLLPRRPARALSELPASDVRDLFATAGAACAAGGGAAGFNWSLRDDWVVGSALEQLHLHVVPRRPAVADAGMFCADFRENDEVYARLEAWHPADGATNAPPAREWPDDGDRRDRTEEEMAAEARGYRGAQAGGAEAVAAALPAAHPFARVALPQGQLFWASALSVAFVNLKPLVPGHVLVTPRRVVPRYGGLTAEEAADLWEGVRCVQAIVGGVRGAVAFDVGMQVRIPEVIPAVISFLVISAFDVGMQDGPIAGQSVPHVHVHVLPK